MSAWDLSISSVGCCDTLYASEAYATEVDFVRARSCAQRPAVHSELDLGCGAGHHGLALARRGVSITSPERRGLELVARATSPGAGAAAASPPPGA